jgi:type II secretion system protein H
MPPMVEKATQRTSGIGNMRGQSITRSGFTLVELMVVLILIGIFTGLIVGEMRGTYEDALLRASARKLVAAANLAGSQAVSTGQPLVLSFNTAQSEYAVHKRSARESQSSLVDEGRLDDRIIVLVRQQEQASSDEPNEAPLTEEQATKKDDIAFYADGTADSREILLRDRTSKELVLRINPITGRIRIVDPDAEVPR